MCTVQSRENDTNTLTRTGSFLIRITFMCVCGAQTINGTITEKGERTAEATAAAVRETFAWWAAINKIDGCFTVFCSHSFRWWRSVCLCVSAFVTYPHCQCTVPLPKWIRYLRLYLPLQRVSAGFYQVFIMGVDRAAMTVARYACLLPINTMLQHVYRSNCTMLWLTVCIDERGICIHWCRPSILRLYVGADPNSTGQTTRKVKSQYYSISHHLIVLILYIYTNIRVYMLRHLRPHKERLSRLMTSVTFVFNVNWNSRSGIIASQKFAMKIRGCISSSLFLLLACDRIFRMLCACSVILMANAK